jgi:predicted permease
MLERLKLLARALVRRRELESELDEEVRFHLDKETEQNIARGMDPEEARFAARRSFGGVERVKEEARDVRGVRMVEEIWQDMRYGFRALVKNRGFAIVSVLTLGLGIGANTAVFSVINAVFLEPLPYHEPDQLVVVWEDASLAGYPRNSHAPGSYLELEAGNTVFEAMAATRSRDYSLTGDGEPERLSAQAVTASLLPMLGTRPALGRTFLPEEDQPGGPRAVMLGHGLWQRRYAGAEDVVGREILLDGEKHAVVGVLPPGFQVLDDRADVLVPMAFPPEARENYGSHYLTVLGRLAPGVAIEGAQAEMQATIERMSRERSPDAPPRGAAVVRLHEAMAGDARQPLAVLVVAVGLVLMIACLNVGNLMLSRAAGRRREIALRAALGASRWRVLRQLLVENVPLVLVGTGVGLLFAYWSFDLLKQLIPPAMGPAAEPGLDVRVLGFTLLVALAATVLFGLVPALQASKADLNDALKRGSARTGFSAGGRLQSALVVGEVGLAIVLLVGASLLIQTFFLLRGQYSDLRGASVLTMKTVLPRFAYDTHPKREAFFEQTVERVGALPGVVAVGYTNALPLDYKGDSNNFTLEGRPPEPGRAYDACTRLVSPGYLEALGVPLRRGRHFAEADGPEALPVAIVNETMERQYWPGEDAVGKRYKLGGPQSNTPWVTVVGVAADVRQNGVDVPAKAEMYLPYRQCDYIEVFAPKTLAIRTSGDPGALVSAVRREIASVDPNQPVSDVKTMNDILGQETSGRRLAMLLLGTFAALALLLASIGIYGLLSQRVAQMTPEIGVRLALGAGPRDVVNMIVWRGMRLVVIGSAAGLALSFVLSRLMASLLFGVSAGDPLTLAGVPILLATVALVACYVPARRAAGVDPTVALRYE